MEYLEIEPISCAAESKLCDAIRRFAGKETPKPIVELIGVDEQFWYDGPMYCRIEGGAYDRDAGGSPPVFLGWSVLGLGDRSDTWILESS